MAYIHAVAPETKQVFSLLGLASTSIYAAIIPSNYYLQLFLVLPWFESVPAGA